MHRPKCIAQPVGPILLDWTLLLDLSSGSHSYIGEFQVVLVNSFM